MKASLAALVLVPALCGFSPAHAACKHKTVAPAVPEPIIVTPNGTYTESQWARREAARNELVAAVTLPTIVITPDDAVTEADRQQWAQAKPVTRSASAQGRAAPGTYRHMSLIGFLRKLFN